MHDHEQATRTGATGRTPASRRASASPAREPGLLGLQGNAGNAAVVQMLRQAGHAWTQEEHRHDAGCGHQEPVQRSAVHDVLRSPGRPLDDATRTDMEARMGTDFSGVRIHNDSAAKASAAEVGAHAYTSGSHIVLGGDSVDSHTLAHELTHVVQQRKGPVAGTDNGDGLKVSDPSDRFEREAEANATRVMAAAPRTAAPQPAAPLQRDAAPSQASSPVHAVQRVPLHVSYEEDAGTARAAVDSDNEQDVRRFVFESILKGNHEAVSLVMNRLEALTPQPAYLESLRQVASQAPAEERPRIPPLVHFIWIGGGISKEALANVLAWAEKAQNSDWRINLWTDKRSTWSWADSLRVKAAKAIEFKYIEDALDERVAATYEKATGGPTKAYPLASDIARYSILKKLGGVYADVDLGSGTIDLKQTRPTLRENDVPVLGPLIRDESSLNASLSAAGAPPVTGVATAEQVRTAARYLLDTGGYGNHFIGAQRNSAVMEKMIDRIARSLGDMDAEELHMAGPVATGPFALIRVVDEHLGSEFGVQSLQAGEHQLFQKAGQQFHDHMQWLTAESENQNY
ncbi:eCIS core domain-containing protein [Streptomyces sp. NPDC001273]|uniref:eCIS core domain-containing protein n=1 Tax=unclassified Streptomyces TaxID=2593676 RepID=UPI0033D2F354